MYMVINGKRRPPMALQVVKPDILFPGKVTVSPYANGINTGGIQSRWRHVVWQVLTIWDNVTYDPANKAFYFTDWYYEDPTQNGSRWYSVIRKIQDSVVTTVCRRGE